MPDIKTDPLVPTGTLYLIPSRKINEKFEDYIKRCGMMTNVGLPERLDRDAK